MFERLVELFTPERGSIATIMSFTVGWLPDISQATRDTVTFIFQITAFSISIMVGILTMIHLHCKLSDRKKRIKNEKD